MREMTYVQALNEGLHQAMSEDPSVFIIGENIRDRMRPETAGLDEAFAPDRVLDMPISEAAFTGFANGAALAGMRPVVEFQVASLMFPAFDQIVNQAAKLPLMLGGQAHIPITFFLMGAGAGGGRAGQHSDNPYTFLVHAGIKTVVPATPADAKGLMLAAIFEDDPVAVVVNANLLGTKGDVPAGSERAALATGAVRRAGTDATICAIGALVPAALDAAGPSRGGRHRRGGVGPPQPPPLRQGRARRIGREDRTAGDRRRLGTHLRIRGGGGGARRRALLRLAPRTDQAGHPGRRDGPVQHAHRARDPAGGGRAGRRRSETSPPDLDELCPTRPRPPCGTSCSSWRTSFGSTTSAATGTRRSAPRTSTRSPRAGCVSIAPTCSRRSAGRAG